MIESFFAVARIQKFIDFGNASEVHSSVTFCPIAAPTNWFWIIIIGGTVWQKKKKHDDNKTQVNQTQFHDELAEIKKISNKQMRKKCTESV